MQTIRWVLNPHTATTALLHCIGLGFSPFARRYSGNRFCFLFLGVLRCFSSPACLHTAIYSLYDTTTLLVMGCPIRIFPGLCLFAAHRNFSQLTTSFFGSWRQGIHRMPFPAWSDQKHAPQKPLRSFWSRSFTIFDFKTPLRWSFSSYDSWWQIRLPSTLSQLWKTCLNSKQLQQTFCFTLLHLFDLIFGEIK